MPVKLRLQRHGRKKAPFYHIVVASSTSPRDGRFIERLGFYNPTSIPAKIEIDIDKAVKWLQNGAQPTTTVEAILRYKGVLYKKHLLRGVSKGSFTMEVAEEKFNEWIESHKSAVLDHVKITEDKKAKIKSDELDRLSKKREEIAAKIASENKVEEEVSVIVEEANAEVQETVSNVEATEEIQSEETTAEENKPE